jgi:hypothetical protein
MAFAQLTYRESLRDIETCLRAMHPKLYHAERKKKKEEKRKKGDVGSNAT